TKKNSESFRRTRRAFYEGGRALARGPTRTRSRRIRGVRRRRSPGSWRRLRGCGTLARLPAGDRAGRPSRVLALDRYVARRHRLVPEARDGRRRLRGGRAQARRDRSRAEAVLSGGPACVGDAEELEHGIGVDVVEVDCVPRPWCDRAVGLPD